MWQLFLWIKVLYMQLLHSLNSYDSPKRMPDGIHFQNLLFSWNQFLNEWNLLVFFSVCFKIHLLLLPLQLWKRELCMIWAHLQPQVVYQCQLYPRNEITQSLFQIMTSSLHQLCHIHTTPLLHSHFSWSRNQAKIMNFILEKDVKQLQVVIRYKWEYALQRMWWHPKP